MRTAPVVAPLTGSVTALRVTQSFDCSSVISLGAVNCRSTNT